MTKYGLWKFGVQRDFAVIDIGIFTTHHLLYNKGRASTRHTDRRKNQRVIWVVAIVDVLADTGRSGWSTNRKSVVVFTFLV
jgi:hypothetical protein